MLSITDAINNSVRKAKNIINGDSGGALAKAASHAPNSVEGKSGSGGSWFEQASANYRPIENPGSGSGKQYPGRLVKDDDGSFSMVEDDAPSEQEIMEANSIRQEQESLNPGFDSTWGHSLKQDSGYEPKDAVEAVSKPIGDLGLFFAKQAESIGGGKYKNEPGSFDLLAETEPYTSVYDLDTSKEQNSYDQMFRALGYDPDDVTYSGIPGMGHRMDSDDLKNQSVPYDEVLMSTMSQLPIDQQYQASYQVNTSKPSKRYENPDDNGEEDYDPVLEVATRNIDDGTLHPENLTANAMTGDQYAKYVQAGMGGRPVDEIDPNATYSKMDEFKNYGFIPYMPDDEAYLKMVREEREADPTKAFNSIATARNNQDYDITIDGKTINGKDLYDNLWKFSNEADRLYSEKYVPLSETYDQNNARTDATAYAIGSYEVRMDDGTIASMPSEYSAKRVSNSDDIILTFGDGSEFLFDNEEDMNSKVRPGSLRKAVDGDRIYTYMPNDIELGDGQAVDALEIMRINSDRGQGNDEGIDYDFGQWNWKRPTYMMNEEGEPNYFDLANLPGNVYDLMAGSLPYFFTSTPAGIVTTAPNAVSRASIASRNIDPSSMTADGVGHVNHGDPDLDKYTAGVVGELAMPLTELGPGIFGKHVLGELPVVKKAAKRIEGKYGDRGFYDPLLLAKGIVGEGAEEIPGNIMEEYTDHGLEGMFGDEWLDENGDVKRTKWGEEIRVGNDDMADRVGNFIEASPNSFAGGALLGTAMSLLPPFKGAKSIGRGMQKAKRNRQRKAEGMRPYEQVYEEGRDIGIGDDLESYFERLVRERGAN